MLHKSVSECLNFTNLISYSCFTTAFDGGCQNIIWTLKTIIRNYFNLITIKQAGYKIFERAVSGLMALEQVYIFVLKVVIKLFVFLYLCTHLL